MKKEREENPKKYFKWFRVKKIEHIGQYKEFNRIYEKKD